MPTIKIRISPNGKQIVVDVEGAQGPVCTQYTERLTRALGEQVSERKKAEFFEDPLTPAIEVGEES